MIPAKAHRLNKRGNIEDVAVKQLNKGDRVVVKPGEKIPVDGVIVDGHSSINEAMISGESRPVEKESEDQVVGGSVNGEASLTVEVQKTGDKTYLSQVVEMVRKAQESRSKTQDLANRAALWLTIIALSAGALTLSTWLWIGSSFNYSLERMVTVMVITCPHALGLAVPLVIAISTSLAAKRALLIRNRSAFERTRRLQAVVFDKTGTLTEGRFGVSNIVALGSETEDEILKWAASVESRSEHPIAQGILTAAEEKKIDYDQAEAIEALSGKGARGQVAKNTIHVVSPGYLKENDIEIDHNKIKSLEKDGDTLVFVLVDHHPVGVIGLTDIVRSESHQAVSKLKERGIHVMMLTGDAKLVAARVAAELGLDEYFAEVLPDQKADKIKEIKARGLTVAMVGDGINDVPALASADAGIAIVAGTDVAIESADIVLVKSDPRDVVAVIDLARKTYRKMVQNLWWATGYNAFAIPLAAGVLFPIGFVLPPAAGALVMSLSTVIVAVNAKLLSSPLTVA
jgi:Cu2+-exporting ATPase